MTTTEKLSLLLRAWLAVAITCLCAALAGHFAIGLNTDHIDIMDQVFRILDGGTPYVDYVDVNPPLIHLLFLPPAYTARLLAIAPHISLYIEVYAIMALSLWCCYRVLEGCPNSIRYLTLSVIALALTVTSFINQVFADREHLFLCFVAPWMLLHAPFVPFAQAPVRWRQVAAVLAAFGFALKPYFLLFYLVAMIGSLRRLPFKAQIKQREHHLIWFMGITYLALIALCFPFYVSEVGPLVWHTYPLSSWPLVSKLDTMKNYMLRQHWPVWIWVAAGLTIVRGDGQRTLFYLLGLQLATMALYMLNAGWWYTTYPFQVINLCLLVMSASALIRLAGGFRTMLLVWLLPAFFATFYYIHVEPALDRAALDIRFQRLFGRPIATYSMPPQAAEQMAKLFDGKKTYTFYSTNLRSLSLLNIAPDLQSIGRYDHVWPLPGLASWPKGKDAALHSWLRDVFINGIADDLRLKKPDLVIFDSSPYQPPLPSHVKPLDFFKAHPTFAAAFKPYKFLKQVNTCEDGTIAACSFEVYARK